MTLPPTGGGATRAAFYEVIPIAYIDFMTNADSLLNSMRPDIYEWGVWRAMYLHDDEPTVEDNIESARALRATINRLTIMLSIRFRK